MTQTRSREASAIRRGVIGDWVRSLLIFERRQRIADASGVQISP